MNETHQLLLCAIDVNLVDENINITKKNTGTVSDASKEVGEVDAERSKLDSTGF
jgi:hypothetical protein